MTKVVTVQAQQKWEYTTMVRKTDTALLVELNTAGLEGWELISVLNYKDLKGVTSWIGFLKRPHTGQPPKPAAEARPAVHTPVEGEATAADAHGFDMAGEEFGVKEE